jgi:hypothetical protein
LEALGPVQHGASATPSPTMWARLAPSLQHPARQRASMRALRRTGALDLILLAYHLRKLLFKKNILKSKKFLIGRGSR